MCVCGLPPQVFLYDASIKTVMEEKEPLHARRSPTLFSLRQTLRTRGFFSWFMQKWLKVKGLVQNLAHLDLEPPF